MYLSPITAVSLQRQVRMHNKFDSVRETSQNCTKIKKFTRNFKIIAISMSIKRSAVR